jgi:hypothetical protein
MIKNADLTMRIDNVQYREALPLSSTRMSPFNEIGELNVIDFANFENTTMFPDIKEQIFSKENG